MSRTREIQERLKQLLNRKLIGSPTRAEKEWDAAKGSTDDYVRKLLYAPKIDIAVSPFMINYNTDDELRKLNKAFNENKQLIESIKQKVEPLENFKYNLNPRCLIAIEIEASGSRKHLIGDIINASILGKIGIIVPTDEKNYTAFKRIMAYLAFAQKNGKISDNVFKNVILIKLKDLTNVLEACPDTERVIA